MTLQIVEKKLMKKIILSFLVVSAWGCSTVDPLIKSAEIPEDASQIIITSNMHPDSLFTLVKKQLALAGYRINNSDKQVLSINTQGKDIGQSTSARFSFVITDNKLIGRADWMPGMQANAIAQVVSGIVIEGKWKNAEWSTGRPKRAFSALVLFMRKIPQQSMLYKN